MTRTILPLYVLSKDGQPVELREVSRHLAALVAHVRQVHYEFETWDDELVSLAWRLASAYRDAGGDE